MGTGILNLEGEYIDMSIISKLKRNKKLQKLYNNVRCSYYSALTIISPVLNTKARYRQVYKKPPNLDKPKSFSEKLLWLKLNKYLKDPLVAQCADKYRVREYISECGCEDILNTLYGVYNSAKDIPWEDLPECFVLKWNFGAGMNIVVKDKSDLDIPATIDQMEKWRKVKYWLPYSEMQYKRMKKRIICEEFLIDNDNPDVIPDYKVYCFHGEPKAILVMHDRGHGIKSEFFDTKWELLENTEKYQRPEHTTPKPLCFDEMIEVSKKLSKPFPFVRCDFYVVNERLYFGELTFTPAGGLYTSSTKIDGKDMSEYLHVPC